jgi:hypothetical protein
VIAPGYHDEVERAIRRVARAREQMNDLEWLPVLLAPYLAPDDRHLCQQNRIGYLDLVGNAGLESPSVYVSIGRSTLRPSSGTQRAISPFEGKAERVARRMLLTPYKTWNMRELAGQCGISLGMASMVTTVLMEQGVVTKTRKGIALFDPKTLLESWEKAYRFARNPYQVFRTSTSPGEVIDRLKFLIITEPDSWALTLWSGAYALLQETPEQARVGLYWAGNVVECAEQLQLRGVTGDTVVVVFQPYDPSVFWQSIMLTNRERVVSPLQLYLDLASGDAEELALAKRVRSKFLSC